MTMGLGAPGVSMAAGVMTLEPKTVITCIQNTYIPRINFGHIKFILVRNYTAHACECVVKRFCGADQT